MTKTHIRRTVAAAVSALVAISLAGCAAGATAEGRVGVSLNSLEYPFIVTMNESITAAAKGEDLALTTVDSRATVATELSQMENLVTQKPDVILMDAVDSKSSVPAGELVNKAGIPLVMVDNTFGEDSGVEIAAYVGTDLTETGRLEAKFLNEALPEGGNIIYLVGVYGAPWSEQRKAGFFEVVNDNITVATETEAQGSRADGKTVMEDLLQRYSAGEIDAVVAQNDEMALGAISAIKEAGRLDEFSVIIGVDGSDAALDAVAAGELTATVRQDPAGVGEAAIEIARKIIEGEKYEKETFVPLTTVTADNVAEFQKK